MNEPAGKRVIFAPDVIGAAFIDASARHLLEQWREDSFKVVTSRQLLLLHVRALNALGLAPELIHRWTLWLTSPARAQFLPEVELPNSSTLAICEALSEASKAPILCWRIPEGANAALWRRIANGGLR